MKTRLVIYTDSDGNPVIQIATSDEEVRSVRAAAKEEKEKGTRINAVPLDELASEPAVKDIEHLLQMAALLDERSERAFWFTTIETLLCLGARLGLKHQGR